MSTSQHRALRGSETQSPAGPAGRPRAHALGKRPPRRGSAGGSAGLLVRALLVLALVWALAASWLAWSGRTKVAHLEEEQAELRLSYEDKIKALTRRLVGVASHGILEQEGLSGRLADIISRQVELENRQATLSIVNDRVTNGTSAASSSAAPGPARTRAEDEAGPAASRARAIGPDHVPAVRPETPSLRLGGPGAAEPGRGALGPRSSLEERSRPAPSGAGRMPEDVQALPLREQFGALEASMARIESAQIRHLGALSAGAQSGIAMIRASLAGLGLTLQPEPAREPARGPVRPALRTVASNPFETRLASLELELAQLDRWRGILELVPLRKPIEDEGSLTSNFGTRKDPFTGGAAMHAGIDFRGPVGTPIRAAAAGRVLTAEASGGYGNLVEVEHGNGIVTRYAHLSAFSVSAGQTVTPGTVVGLLGSTGRSTGPHLHFETRIGGSAVDPMRFLLAGAQLFNHPPPIEIAAGGEGETSFD